MLRRAINRVLKSSPFETLQRQKMAVLQKTVISRHGVCSQHVLAWPGPGFATQCKAHIIISGEYGLFSSQLRGLLDSVATQVSKFVFSLSKFWFLGLNKVDQF